MQGDKTKRAEHKVEIKNTSRPPWFPTRLALSRTPCFPNMVQNIQGMQAMPAWRATGEMKLTQVIKPPVLRCKAPSQSFLKVPVGAL